MKKSKNLCTDCWNYVPNGEVCKCHSKILTLDLVSIQKKIDTKNPNNIAALKKLKKEYPFKGAGIVFSSEIDVFND